MRSLSVDLPSPVPYRKRSIAGDGNLTAAPKVLPNGLPITHRPTAQFNQLKIKNQRSGVQKFKFDKNWSRHGSVNYEMELLAPKANAIRRRNSIAISPRATTARPSFTNQPRLRSFSVSYGVGRNSLYDTSDIMAPPVETNQASQIINSKERSLYGTIDIGDLFLSSPAKKNVGRVEKLLGQLSPELRAKVKVQERLKEQNDTANKLKVHDFHYRLIDTNDNSIVKLNTDQRMYMALSNPQFNVSNPTRNQMPVLDQFRKLPELPVNPKQGIKSTVSLDLKNIAPEKPQLVAKKSMPALSPFVSRQKAVQPQKQESILMDLPKLPSQTTSNNADSGIKLKEKEKNSEKKTYAVTASTAYVQSCEGIPADLLSHQNQTAANFNPEAIFFSPKSQRTWKNTSEQKLQKSPVFDAKNFQIRPDFMVRPQTSFQSPVVQKKFSDHIEIPSESKNNNLSSNESLRLKGSLGSVNSLELDVPDANSNRGLQGKMKSGDGLDHASGKSIKDQSAVSFEEFFTVTSRSTSQANTPAQQRNGRMAQVSPIKYDPSMFKNVSAKVSSFSDYTTPQMQLKFGSINPPRHSKLRHQVEPEKETMMTPIICSKTTPTVARKSFGNVQPPSLFPFASTKPKDIQPALEPVPEPVNEPIVEPPPQLPPTPKPKSHSLLKEGPMSGDDLVQIITRRIKCRKMKMKKSNISGKKEISLHEDDTLLLAPEVTAALREIEKDVCTNEIDSSGKKFHRKLEDDEELERNLLRSLDRDLMTMKLIDADADGNLYKKFIEDFVALQQKNFDDNPLNKFATDRIAGLSRSGTVHFVWDVYVHMIQHDQNYITPEMREKLGQIFADSGFELPVAKAAIRGELQQMTRDDYTTLKALIGHLKRIIAKSPQPYQETVSRSIARIFAGGVFGEIKMPTQSLLVSSASTDVKSASSVIIANSNGETENQSSSGNNSNENVNGKKKSYPAYKKYDPNQTATGPKKTENPNKPLYYRTKVDLSHDLMRGAQWPANVTITVMEWMLQEYNWFFQTNAVDMASNGADPNLIPFRFLIPIRPDETNRKLEIKDTFEELMMKKY